MFGGENLDGEESEQGGFQACALQNLAGVKWSDL